MKQLSFAEKLEDLREAIAKARRNEVAVLGGPGLKPFEEIPSDDHKFDASFSDFSIRKGTFIPTGSKTEKEYMTITVAVTSPNTGETYAATVDPDALPTSEKVTVAITQGNEIPKGKRNEGKHYPIIRVVSAKVTEPATTTTTANTNADGE